MRHLERLWPLSLTAKVGAGALLLMLLAMYGGYRVEHQAYVEAGKSRDVWQKQHEQYLARWHRVAHLNADARSAPWLEEQDIPPFSPVDFQRSDARLAHWQPSEAGGEISLDTPWYAVPGIFLRLAERGMRVVGFTLATHDDVLRFTLQLVRDDES
ncbi:hypothetical protein [Kluyvera sp. 142486]|uniref:HofO family protein n=1 Tax=Kluyvera sp. 142486 TaxID=3390050 RepID=UPI0039818D66